MFKLEMMGLREGLVFVFFPTSSYAQDAAAQSVQFSTHCWFCLHAYRVGCTVFFCDAAGT
jgi:hypothetical protein